VEIQREIYHLDMDVKNDMRGKIGDQIGLLEYKNKDDTEMMGFETKWVWIMIIF